MQIVITQFFQKWPGKFQTLLWAFLTHSTVLCKNVNAKVAYKLWPLAKQRLDDISKLSDCRKSGLAGEQWGYIELGDQQRESANIISLLFKQVL